MFNFFQAALPRDLLWRRYRMRIKRNAAPAGGTSENARYWYLVPESPIRGRSTKEPARVQVDLLEKWWPSLVPPRNHRADEASPQRLALACLQVPATNLARQRDGAKGYSRRCRLLDRFWDSCYHNVQRLRLRCAALATARNVYCRSATTPPALNSIAGDVSMGLAAQ